MQNITTSSTYESVGELLLASVGMRDDAWHDALCKEHGERLVRMLARLLAGDLHTARDLAQEVLITAWEKRDVVPDEPLPWLFTTADFHLRNYRRKAANQPHQVFDPESMANLNPQPAADAKFDEPDLELGGQLDSLSSTDLKILGLYYHNRLDTNEIANFLSISPDAARQRLSRARRKADPILKAHRRPKEA